jgi:transmembrane sensor
MQKQYNNSYLRELAHKWRNGTLTDQENTYLEEWDNSQRDDLLQLPDDSGGPDAVKARMYERLMAAIQENQSIREPKKYINTKWLSVAASIIMILGIGFWFFHTARQGRTNLNTKSSQYENDAAPGKNGATLMLPDGTVVALSDTQTGVVLHSDKITYDDGTRVNGDFKNIEDWNSAGTPSLTASTAKGQTYVFTLADGTRIWLNAGSTLKFPANFDGLSERSVELTGEAYFEVSKINNTKAVAARVPFIVNSKGQRAEVLGTRFNISTYEDVIKTTLFEGSIKVTQVLQHPAKPAKKEIIKGDKTNNGIILKPGQQSVIELNSLYPNDLKVLLADTEEAQAWRNGDFFFRDESIESIMLRLSYWYDVEVVYEGSKHDTKFGGSISRNIKLSKVLSLLEATGMVKFRIEGKKVHVSR